MPLRMAFHSLCLQCHDDPADEGKVHPIIEDEGCLACHDPHSSMNNKLLVESPDNLCLDCHDDKLEGNVVHEAATDGGCTDCHNPHSSKNDSLLVENPPDLCAQCHDDPSLEGKVHPVIEDDGCLACHNPHSAEKKALLDEPPPELCMECHDDVAEGSYVHGAITDGTCTDCHDPHASKNSPLLVEAIPELCGECHDVPDPEDSVLHTAVSDGNCTDCHFPHAGDKPRLLKEEYDTVRYPKGFSEKMYALCFDCHDTSLVTGEAESTGFRDGEKNLHGIHVSGALIPNKYGIIKRGKARSCSMCHDPHGSTQDYNLIRQYSSNGMSIYSLDYTPLQDGGRCMVGCHKPRAYHRTTTTAVAN